MKKSYLLILAFVALLACNQTDNAENEVAKLQKKQLQLKDKYEELLNVVEEMTDCMGQLQKTADRIDYYINSYNAENHDPDSLGITIENNFQNMNATFTDNERMLNVLEKKMDDMQLQSKQLKKLIATFKDCQEYDKERMEELKNNWEDQLTIENERLEQMNEHETQQIDLDSIA